MMNDERFMEEAIAMAKKAYKKGEIPIGAVIVSNGRVVAKSYNNRERSKNATNHAEVRAIRKLCRKRKSWRLDDCVMYVTLQPCVMCAGAILNSRISRVVVGARSDRTNDADVFANNNLNWKTEVDFVDNPECSDLLKDFFKKARQVSGK